jgi:hypothetical protein
MMLKIRNNFQDFSLPSTRFFRKASKILHLAVEMTIFYYKLNMRNISK